MPVILFAVFIDLVGFGLIVPILPFLTMAYGGDALSGTALISIYSLMTFLSGPFWGRLSDKIGRRPALALTFAGGTLSYLTLAFSDSLAMLFFARAMSGAMAGNIGVVMAAVADMTDAENRGRAMGWIGGVFGLGFAVGPGLGGWLGTGDGTVSILLPGLVAAGLAFTAMLLTFFFVPETSPGHVASAASHGQENTGDSSEPAPGSLSRRDLLFKSPWRFLLFLMFVVTAIGQSVSFSITPFWAESTFGWSGSQVGVLLMAIGLCVAAVQTLAVGPLFRHLGEVRTISLGSIVSIAGCGLIIFGPSTPLVAILGFPLVMGGLTVAFPALNSLVSLRTDRHNQGVALGMSQGLSALGRIVGPLSAGAVFSTSAPGLPFVIVAATAVIAGGWAFAEWRRDTPENRS